MIATVPMRILVSEVAHHDAALRLAQAIAPGGHRCAREAVGDPPEELAVGVAGQRHEGDVAGVRERQAVREGPVRGGREVDDGRRVTAALPEVIDADEFR